MTRNESLALGAAVAALLLFGSRRAQAATFNPGADIVFGEMQDAGDYIAPENYSDADFAYDGEGESEPELVTDAGLELGADPYDLLGVGLPTFYSGQNEVDAMMNDSRVAALLYAIRMCEHFPADVASNADYGTFYGGSRFTNMSDHPVTTGEKAGIRLPPAMCRRAGFPGGVCVSTAAGAYQFTRPTWARLREKAPRLGDFSPLNQDIAAVRLLEEIGALALLRAGNVEGAIRKAGTQWASLPGSTAGQNPKPMAYVIGKFNEVAQA